MTGLQQGRGIGLIPVDMIEFRNVTLAYRDRPVLRGIDLTVPDRELCALIGASGSGKTTLLKLVNRLHAPDSGEVLVDGRPVAELPLARLPGFIGYVVQEGGLFPHLSAAENIRLALELAGKTEALDRRIDEMLELVGLDPAIHRDAYPAELSGGQRQRVGIARAFAPEPPIVLMDEPFSALDPVTRTSLQDAVVRLKEAFGKTVLFVTHDMDEAIRMADRICVLENGRIVQNAAPEEILKHPATAGVRRFIGKEKLWQNPDLIRAEELTAAECPTIRPDRSVREALRTMKAFETETLFVVDENERLLGRVSAKDLRARFFMPTSIARSVRPVETVVERSTTFETMVERELYRNDAPIAVVDADEKLLGSIEHETFLAMMSRSVLPKGAVQNGEAA